MTHQAKGNADFSPDDEFRTAQKAFREGELRHAVYHLSWALSKDPQRREWLALLDQIIAASNQPFWLVPLQKGIDFANAAVAAYIYAKSGNIERALQIMTEISQVAPQASYLSWIVEWLADSEAAASVTPNTMMVLVSALISHYPGDNIDETTKHHFARILPALAQSRTNNPHVGELAALQASLLRKLGKLDESVAAAQAGYTAAPNWLTAMQLGAAYRSKGQIDEALTAYGSAIAHQPNDDSVRLDAGDMLCQSGRIADGVRFYKEVLDRTPNHPWAAPYYCYYQYRLTKAQTWYDQLQQFASQHPENVEAEKLVRAVQRQTSAYTSYLPEPSEAIINIIRQFAAQNKPGIKGKGGNFNVGISALEAPSAISAVQRFLHENYGVGLNVGVAELQTPDPRYPRGNVDFVLWRYNNTDPEPAVPPPADRVAKAIAEIAASPYSLQEWRNQAQTAASAIGVASINDLLGVMVHPPVQPRPKGSLMGRLLNRPETTFAIWDWTHRVQVAAALTIACLDSGWDESVRKRALFSLARGPMDWTIGAAIIAVTKIGLDFPAARPDIFALFAELLDDIPRGGMCPYTDALCQCGLMLPSLPDDLRARLEQEQITL
ncbi:MAG: hypothetical protein IT324_20430 [Anaerolineae bacterium]|nr:hypothetical protein [Anaerolineae bacterium]